MNRLTVAAVLGLALALTATNAGAKPLEAVATPTASDNDREILAAIIASTVADVKLCDLAVQRSQNADILAFCRSSSADNGHIAVQSAQLASRVGASDGTLLTSTQTPPAVDSLSGLSGREFDRAFLLTQIAADGTFGHTLRFAYEFGTNTVVRRFESNVMTIVFRHIDTAETILRRLSETTP